MTMVKKLKKMYKDVAKQYGNIFSLITDKQGEWSSDYDIWFTEEGAFNISEVRYIVDTFAENKQTWKYVREELSDWEDYLCDCNEFAIQYINLPSWFACAPRMSKEARELLHKRKAELMACVAEQQQQFGEQDRSNIPQHHKKPF